MIHEFGIDQYQYQANHRMVPIAMDTSALINGHLLITGMSGTGKSHQLRALMHSAIHQGIELDIFDVHDELEVSGAASALFSETTRYGFNPLVLNPDPHSGGVRKRINEIISLINNTSHKLGIKQETALRNLLGDIYFLNGCYDNNSSSWLKREITEYERDQLIQNKQYGALKQYYPTIEDLRSYGERKLKSMYVGTDSKAIAALERVNSMAGRINKLITKVNKPGQSHGDIDGLKAQLEELKEKSRTTFNDYLSSIETGRELADLIKYNSKDVLQSVVERLQSLNASGIFRSNPPPFHGSRARRYMLKSLNADEKKLLIYSRLEAIFRQSMDAGIQDQLRRVVVIDEAHRVFDEEEENILNIISKEGRKFGLAIWAASPAPTHFSDDFLTNCGTTVVLAVHTQYWDQLSRKLQIDTKMLKHIEPHRTAAIRLQSIGGGAQFRSSLLRGNY